MKRILVVLTALLVSIAFYGQNLDKMPKAEREALLLKKAKELVLRHGPGYWREYQPPIIERYEMPTSGYPIGKNIGRDFYSVNIPFDPQKERFNYKYAASVTFWADTGEPRVIMFGNGKGFSLDKDDEKRTKSDQVEVMPFQTLDDQIKEEKERYRRMGREWKD